MKAKPSSKDYDAFEDGFVRGYFAGLHKKAVAAGIDPGPAYKPELVEAVKKQAQLEFSF